MPSCEFWPDGSSCMDADLRHVRGHRQVTDAYLVSLAAGRRGAELATLDEELCQELPERTLLLPRA
jgi:predicted nucleic acid-binding protein